MLPTTHRAQSPARTRRRHDAKNAFSAESVSLPAPCSPPFPFSLRTCFLSNGREQNLNLNRYCLGDGKGKVDQRLADVVRYRLARKETHSLAVDILEEYLAPPPAPPVVQDTAEDGQEGADSAPVESLSLIHI